MNRFRIILANQVIDEFRQRTCPKKESSVCILVRVCVWRAGKQKGKKLCCNHKLSCRTQGHGLQIGGRDASGPTRGQICQSGLRPHQSDR